MAKVRLQMSIAVVVRSPEDAPQTAAEMQAQVPFHYHGVCLDCSTLALADTGFLLEERIPCSHCGSLQRRYPQFASYATSGGVGIKMVTDDRTPSGRKTCEEYIGPSFSRALKRLVLRHMLVDRSLDWYREVVVDPESGEVLRVCSEPLSKHQNRGSAREAKRCTGSTSTPG